MCWICRGMAGPCPFLARYQVLNPEIRGNAQQQIHFVGQQDNAEGNEQQAAQNHDHSHVFLDGFKMAEE